jgi:hypothetical protein
MAPYDQAHSPTGAQTGLSRPPIPMSKKRELVPLAQLIDVQALAAPGRPLTPRRIREALPRGWALAEDNQHAYKDVRLFFREGWILILGLLIFGALGSIFIYRGLPAGFGGLARLVGLLAVLLLVGGYVGPLITRALTKR